MKNKEKLTNKQQKLYDFVVSYHEKYKKYPTYEEIINSLGFDRAEVYYLEEGLKKKNYHIQIQSKLSKKEFNYYQYIIDYQKKHHKDPSQKEIMDAMEWKSVSSLIRMRQSLASKGVEEQCSNLTKKQQEVYDYIISFRAKFGKEPTYREIQSELNYKSTAQVFQIVQILNRKGYKVKTDAPIDEQYQKAIIANNGIAMVPVINSLEEIEYRSKLEGEKEFPILLETLDNKDAFLYSYNETTLTKYGILKGDYLLFELSDQCDEDNIFIVYYDGKHELARYIRQGEKFVPISINSDKIILHDDVQVRAVLRGNLRFKK